MAHLIAVLVLLLPPSAFLSESLMRACPLAHCQSPSPIAADALSPPYHIAPCDTLHYTDASHMPRPVGVRIAVENCGLCCGLSVAASCLHGVPRGCVSARAEKEDRPTTQDVLADLGSPQVEASQPQITVLELDTGQPPATTYNEPQCTKLPSGNLLRPSHPCHTSPCCLRRPHTAFVEAPQLREAFEEASNGPWRPLSGPLTLRHHPRRSTCTATL